MLNRKRVVLGLVTVAIYVIILLICCLRSDASIWPWHHTDKQAYIKRVNQDLKAYALILGVYQAHPPTTSTADQDQFYITRGEMDISIVEEKLRRYEKGNVEQSVVDNCLRQLERDIEDLPAFDDKRSKS